MVAQPDKKTANRTVLCSRGKTEEYNG